MTIRSNRSHLMIALIAFIVFGKVSADSTARQYHIPAQPLNSALMRFASDSNLELLYTADKLRAFKTGGLEGNMTPAQALSRLLQGSGMSYRFVDANTVTIESPSGNLIKTADTADNPATQSGGEGQMMPKVTVEADAESDPNDPVNTSDPYNKSYSVSKATTATRTDTPIFDIPGSIQVVPKSVMNDQQAVKVEDVTKNVSGVFNLVSSNQPFYDSLMLRGFRTGQRLYIDGQRDLSHARSLANIERIDVLKGPSAMLYGRLQPGGLINLVTKRPLDTPYYSVQQQFGSFDFYRTLIDATGPITKDHSLLYRMNFEYQDSASFQGFVNRDRIFVAPSLTWRISDHTQLDLDFRYKEIEGQTGPGIPFVGGNPPNIPISRFLGDPELDHSWSAHYFGGATLSHAFDDNWKLRAKFGANGFKSREFGSTIVDFDEKTGIAKRGYYVEDPFTEDSYAGNVDINGKFETWNLKHNVLLGFDYYRQLAHEDAFFLCESCGTQTFPRDINIYKPTYGQTGVNLALEKPNSLYKAFDEWYGVYFQDQVEFLKDWQLLFGGSYYWATYSLSFNPGGADPTVVKDDDFNPRVGLLYHPLPWLSVYGSWSQAFNSPNSARLAPGTIPVAERSEQFEFGLKGEWLDGKVNSTLAFYDLTKSNIARLHPDPNLAGQGFNVLSGEGRSRGLEFDVAGQLTENWRVIGNYTYTDTEYTKDVESIQGNQFTDVPLHSASLWTTYDFADFGLPGLNAGTGTFMASERQADSQNTFQLPGFVRVDASLGYGWKVGPTKLSVQFNVENLLGKKYYNSTSFHGSSLNIIPGTPRNFMGSIRVEF